MTTFLKSLHLRQDNMAANIESNPAGLISASLSFWLFSYTVISWVVRLRSRYHEWISSILSLTARSRPRTPFLTPWKSTCLDTPSIAVEWQEWALRVAIRLILAGRQHCLPSPYHLREWSGKSHYVTLVNALLTLLLLLLLVVVNPSFDVNRSVERSLRETVADYLSTRFYFKHLHTADDGRIRKRTNADDFTCLKSIYKHSINNLQCGHK